MLRDIHHYHQHHAINDVDSCAIQTVTCIYEGMLSSYGWLQCQPGTSRTQCVYANEAFLYDVLVYTPGLRNNWSQYQQTR